MDISNRLGPRARALRLAMRVVRNRDDAEDAVQDTLLNLYEAEGRLQLHDDSPSAQVSYAFSTLQRACVNITRKRSRAASIDDEAACWTNLEAQLLEQAAIRHALAALPDPWREVVILIDLEQFSYNEVAELIHVPVGTVRSRLSRAHGRLRQNLSV